MSAYIRTLNNGDDILYPRTKVSAITDNNNKNLDTILTEITAGIPTNMSQLNNDAGYVKNTDYATNKKGGVVQVTSGNGLSMTSDGKLRGNIFTAEQYAAASNNALICHATLENVLTAKGYVSNTSYASSSVAGVVKTHGTAYGVTTGSDGNIRAYALTVAQYDSASNYAFIGKATLENVLNSKKISDEDVQNVWNETSTSKGTIAGDAAVAEIIKLTKANILNVNRYDILDGKKAVFLGDSQTEVNYHKTKIWWEWVRDILSLGVCVNAGLSGSTISNHGDGKSMVERYSSLPDDADIVFVMGGVNDVWFSQPLGSITDTTDTTIYGGCRALCTGLRAKYHAKPIIFINCTAEDNSQCVSTYGVEAYDVAKAMKEACFREGILCLDAYGSLGINPKYDTTYTTDALHLNDKGHELLGKWVAEQVKQNVRSITNTKRMVITTRTPDSFIFNFTALVRADSDFTPGSTIEFTFAGANSENCINCTNPYASVFDDTTGELGNSQYVNIISPQATSTILVNGDEVIGNISTNIAIAPSNQYVKIPIGIDATALIASDPSTFISFDLVSAVVKVNGVAKDIIGLGSFFTGETIITV